jgi:hypothetical protein
LPAAINWPDRASPVFAAKLAGVARQVFVMKGGMEKNSVAKQRQRWRRRKTNRE